MEEIEKKNIIAKQRLVRCAEWLLEQNNQQPKRSENLNDIQFIVETNADRKNFLLAAVDDDTSVPAGVGEAESKPVPVPIHRLRVDMLRLECEWQYCVFVTSNYESFQQHVDSHTKDVHIISMEDKRDYLCLWDICSYRCENFKEMTRHINYHSYHSKLMAIGFNGRATLKLARCNKDSTKRNQLPVMKSEFECLWIGCNCKLNSMQLFLNHVKTHVTYSESKKCSWAGCGASFRRGVLLSAHVRRHTGERLIACYHCGMHFASNSKLWDHLGRQMQITDGGITCEYCGSSHASERLRREHSRQHVSMHACVLCDMTVPTMAALALHVRYRHLGHDPSFRLHKCSDCDYRAVTKSDLKKHMPKHKKRKRADSTDQELSDDASDLESGPPAKKKKKNSRKYCCHMCTKNKVYSRGSSLTAHLVNVHGMQRTFGYNRFRYQIGDDGMYRVTTTRFESLEVSKTVYEGSVPKKPLTDAYIVESLVKTEPTEFKPHQYTIKLREATDTEDQKETLLPNTKVEITMCDVDAQGNVIHSEVVETGVLDMEAAS